MIIEETIIKTLQDSIDGTGQLMRFPMTQAVREVVRHGDAAELHRQMEPFYEMWIEDSPRLDWTSRSVISDIAQIDPMFGEWASRQDLMKIACAELFFKSLKRDGYNVKYERQINSKGVGEIIKEILGQE